jgi:hypothetical protein
MAYKNQKKNKAHNRELSTGRRRWKARKKQEKLALKSYHDGQKEISRIAHEMGLDL